MTMRTATPVSYTHLDVYKRQGVTYPWEVLPKIKDFIVELGNTLDVSVYEKRGENIWVAKSAKVAETAFLNGPLIIDEGAEVRHCAFIRGNAIVGKNCVVGNSTELKNVILFNSVQVPHYNYVGDSILGHKSHMGAGSITSNVKSDKTCLLYTSSTIMMHLSRFSEEVIIWNSNEYQFVEIDDAYSTGSSIMPQKKNPDIAELVRGKTGRVYGALVSLLTTMRCV